MELPSIFSDLITACAQRVGIHYLPSKKEYKVVRLFHNRFYEDDIDAIKVGCKILTISNYTSGTSRSIDDCYFEWRVLEEGAPQVVDDSHPELVNESMHWKIYPARNRVSEDEQIMCLNLEDKKFWILPAPAFVQYEPRSFNLAVLKEKLWLNHFDYDRHQVMDMWVLKDYDMLVY